jgi:hypothetical protein
MLILTQYTILFMEDERVRITFTLDKSLKIKLRTVAAEGLCTVGEIIENALVAAYQEKKPTVSNGATKSNTNSEA